MAPTGSSILSRSRPSTEKTTITPPTAPISVAARGEGVNGSAVIATSPAKAPFSTMVRSARPRMNLAASRAATTPPAAAALVLTKTAATALASPTLDTTSSDPPLNPNHPIQRMNVPKVARGRFAPGSALILPALPYLPLRAPTRITPASAAVAPVR